MTNKITLVSAYHLTIHYALVGINDYLIAFNYLINFIGAARFCNDIAMLSV